MWRQRMRFFMAIVLVTAVATPVDAQRQRSNGQQDAEERRDERPARKKRLTAAERAAIALEYREKRRRAIGRSIGGGTRVPLQEGPSSRQSQAGVCRSQCALERSTCDTRGAGAFRERSDQIQAYQSSCYLAVQSCLARCR